MASPTPPREVISERFSLPRFAFTVLVTVLGLLAILRWALPNVWHDQWRLLGANAAVAFVALMVVNCFFEYFFHRYALHTPAIPWVRRLYQQHTLHHALTRIGRKPGGAGRELVLIENKFPMTEPEQGEASFFPWYALAAFALLLSPFLALLQWLLPAYPWFLTGIAALTVSLTLYEVFHAINHWPLEAWDPLITHPRWSWFWRPIYSFHLRHHAVIDCNESVSGFFGLPLADWVFGTCVIPRSIYAADAEWRAAEFRRPVPRWPIRALDAWADRVVRRRRDTAASRPVGPVKAPLVRRSYTRGEERANWVTHAIGIVASAFGLVWLIGFSHLRGDAWHVVSFTVFGVSLLVLYTASTLYHSQRSDPAKQRFRKLDRAAIYFLIAGTYTPFLLTELRGPFGWTLFGVIWVLCGAGAFFQLFAGERTRFPSTLAYLVLGWLIIVAAGPLLKEVPPGGLWLLLAGGLCYTAGVVFYRWQRLRYHHAVWHAFVLGGSTCHYCAILLFLLPAANVAT